MSLPEDPQSKSVVVTDIDIPFGRLVAIFIKWGLAAIPAAIIVSIILSLVMVLLGGLFSGGMFSGGMFSGMHSSRF